MKKKALLALLLVCIGVCTHAEGDITVKYNGKTVNFNEKSILVNDKTLVQLRPIAEAMGLNIEFNQANGNVILSDGETKVIFRIGLDKVMINDETVQMDVPMMMQNDYTFVPVRELAEPFGCEVGYDGESRMVTVESPDWEENDTNGTDAEDATSEGKSTFYYQAQPEFALSGHGRGYCWVCSYAMLMTDVTGQRITPADVAAINIQRGYSGSYMSGHETLVAEFGCTLVPALSADSVYYNGFNEKNKGETRLKASTDEEMYKALCEALERHPEGVIVRFERYPHSMVSTECKDGTVYFNDPGRKSSQHVPLSETSLTGYKLSEISFIQAIERKQ